MAIRTKEKQESFKFSPEARKYFAKEISKFDFYFDKFLLDKKAIKKGFETNKHGTFPYLAVLEYETQELRDNYISKFISNTPYYSLEAITEEYFWVTPFSFWEELRNQSKNEEWSAWSESERFEDIRTGVSHNQRIQKMMSDMSSQIRQLSKNITIG